MKIDSLMDLIRRHLPSLQRYRRQPTRRRRSVMGNALPHVNVSQVCQVLLHHGGGVNLHPISPTRTKVPQLLLSKRDLTGNGTICLIPEDTRTLELS
jgi:hypothetical protein